MNCRRRISRKKSTRGFALFAVVVLMAVMTAAVALALDDAVVAVRNSSGVRASEMIQAGLDRGVNEAIAALQEVDPVQLLDAPQAYDLFAGPSDATSATELDVTGAPMVFPYPDAGPYAGQYTVRVGLRVGQRTRAPVGTSATNAFGQVFEIQVGVTATGPGVPPAEQRVSVGVLVPRPVSHSQ